MTHRVHHGLLLAREITPILHETVCTTLASLANSPLLCLHYHLRVCMISPPASSMVYVLLSLPGLSDVCTWERHTGHPKEICAQPLRM